MTKRQMKTTSMPETLGDILGREVRRASTDKKGVDKARRKWQEVVGPVLTGRTEVLSLRAGVLRVRVESSVLLQELAGVYRRQLLLAMSEGEEPVSLRNIEFELEGGASA